VCHDDGQRHLRLPFDHAHYQYYSRTYYSVESEMLSYKLLALGRRIPWKYVVFGAKLNDHNHSFGLHFNESGHPMGMIVDLMNSFIFARSESV
jgi:hypothetical protein